MDNILEIAVALAICAPIALPIIREWRRADRKKKEEEEALYEFETGAGAGLDNVVTDTKAEQVRGILTDCRRDLDRQHAAGFGPWISALLDGGYEMEVTGYDRQGVPIVARDWTECSAAEALTAVRWTLQELAGSRFNTSKLQEAVALLEAIAE